MFEGAGMANARDESNARGVWAWWPLRLVVFFFGLIFVYAGSQFAIFYLAKHPIGLPKDIISLVAGFVAFIVMIAAYRLAIRWTERRSAGELGAKGALSLFAGGALIGVLLFCTVYAVLWSYGVATFKGAGNTDGLALALTMSLLAGVGEELIFRGAVYRLFEEGFGTTIAVLISGALFGLLHAGNPGATAASSIAIALEAGVLLAAAYAVTRSLWLPIGLHFGWNFTEGGIFGAAVSGHPGKGLINVSLAGPDYLTGGKFGPESSVAAVGACLAVALVMLVLAARRGEWKPMRFRFRTAPSSG
jgi:uncharacterized protein